jgi:two-component system, cell cycle sensor histidine kinase and response regulator CckA
MAKSNPIKDTAIEINRPAVGSPSRLGNRRAIPHGWRLLLSLCIVVMLRAEPLPALAFDTGTNGTTVIRSVRVGQIESATHAFMTDIYDISLALTTTLLLAALGWSVSLRRRVNEQAERIREQLGREADLERKYTELFEHANDMVFSLNAAGRFTALNKTSERILGCSREKCLHRVLKDFVVEAHLQAFNEWMGKCMAGAVVPPLELEICGANGSRSFLELSTQSIREGDKITGIQGIARDVTERRKSAEALRQSEERFSSAFRVSPVAIAVSNLKDGAYIDVNESFVRLFGFQREEVIGHTAVGLKLWADPQDQKKMDQILEKRQSVGGVECDFRVKSGELRNALLFVEPIDLNNTPCALTIVHDMTERLALESKLRQAMKLEAVGRLAAAVAHDFNNLLTIIQGNATMALYQNSQNPAVAKALDRISEASHRAANLTRQLLTFSRKQTPQPKPLDLNEVINGTTRLFKHLLGDELLLRFRFAPRLPIINADPTMIEQVIMNLVVNARDAMPKGGELGIHTDFVEIDPAYVKSHPEASPGHHVCLTVSDTGCGMDLATRTRIFEPFFTTKDLGKGTGLGLATVYGIVKQHKGWLEVTSEVDKGSMFKVYIPSEKPAEPSGTGFNSLASSGPRKTILIVEDEPGVAELARVVLQEDGFRVLEASDGLGALQIWHDNSGNIDLLLTGINMPHGMSGVDLADNLRALKPELRLVYMSGGNPEGVMSDLQSGDDAVFLAKPFSPAHLQQTVGALLNEKPALAAV